MGKDSPEPSGVAAPCRRVSKVEGKFSAISLSMRVFGQRQEFFFFCVEKSIYKNYFQPPPNIVLIDSTSLHRSLHCDSLMISRVNERKTFLLQVPWTLCNARDLLPESFVLELEIFVFISHRFLKRRPLCWWAFHLQQTIAFLWSGERYWY